ncbi:MAG: 4Fe-4S cluster-binding domain-containing protein [bacterium]|nr:4Fe-4S cluster-binding domain-containing protein [bacterium]
MPGEELSLSQKSDRRFAVVLNITKQCNLKCKYCYEPNKSREDKNVSMGLEVAKKTIRHYMELDNGYIDVEFQLFGGESMLEFRLIRQIVDWFHTMTWKKGHVFFICTNGTFLTDEMKQWLYENRECVVPGFSIDGNRTAHNMGRDNSYDLLKPNIPFFVENWPTQPAKMTVYSETIPYLADSVIELEEMGLYFSANIVFEDIWGDSEQKKKLLEVYNKQLEKLVDYYVEHPELEPVGPLLNKDPGLIPKGAVLNYSDGNCSRYCGAGHEMVMVDVDGKEYPCHRFAPWVTGRPAPRMEVNRQETWQPQKCADCELVSLCPTCAGFNWEINGDTGIRTTFHCEAFKLELLASAKLAALRLEKHQVTDIEKMPNGEAVALKKRIDGLLQLAEKGLM